MTEAERFHVPDGFRKLVERHADELGFSLREIARRAEISVSFLSRILAGERGLPGDDVLLKLAKVLDIRPPELLLVEAGRVPQKSRVIKLLRAVSGLSAEDLDQVNKVASALVEKRRKKARSQA